MRGREEKEEGKERGKTGRRNSIVREGDEGNKWKGIRGETEKTGKRRNQVTKQKQNKTKKLKSINT